MELRFALKGESTHFPGGLFQPFIRFIARGHPDGSVVECMPLAQVAVSGSWDQVPHQAPHGEPASPSMSLRLSVCLPLIDK